MKLYTVQGSNNCRRVIATAQHIGAKLELVNMDFAKGDLQKPEYLAVHPGARVPGLRDGDFTLFESTAIMQYLCDKTPGQTLLPTDAQGRANVTRWQTWDLAHFGAAALIVTFERVVKPMFMKQEPDENLVKYGLAQFERNAPALNGQLGNNQWVAGDKLSLADFSIGGSLTYAVMAQLPLASYPNIGAWLARLDQVPAWAETAPKLG